MSKRISITLQGGSSVQIKKYRVKVCSIYILKANATDVLVLRNGLVDGSPATLTIPLDNVLTMPVLEIPFENGLRATFTGTTAIVLLTYE